MGTTGTDYWAVDQSCMNLTGMVGANPTTLYPVLYKNAPPLIHGRHIIHLLHTLILWGYSHSLHPRWRINRWRHTKIRFLLTLLVLFLSIPSFAAEYYVSTTGSAGNPGTLARPWTLAKANTSLVAGDTVNIMAGTYTTAYINPTSSGTPGNPITYTTNGTDVVTISGQTHGILLNGKSYITITGSSSAATPNLIFTNMSAEYAILENSANHNIIAYSSFDNSSNSRSTWVLVNIYLSSSYNWVHHNTISNNGGCAAADWGSLLDIGNGDYDAADYSYYNLVENNTMFHGGHHVVGVMGRYNTVRNNYFHNEGWSGNGGYGGRCIYTGGGYASDMGYNLIEGNRLGYSASSCGGNPNPAILALTTSYNIARYNTLFYPIASCIAFGSYHYQNSAYDIGSYCRVYNNTCYGGTMDAGVNFTSTDNVGEVLKNNLYYANYQNQAYTGSPSSNATYSHEFIDTTGDPLFVSPAKPSDLTSLTLPNLSLQASSPAINYGGPLTTVTSGCGTSSLVLADASYFQDGTWGPPGIIQPDWLAIGTVSNVYQISSISVNNVTFTGTVSCTNGNSVWLYKKSDGVRILYGAAPDAGAYEYLTKLYADFAGNGIWKYDGTSWSQITPNVPTAMTASGSLLYGNFGTGAGIWKWNGSSWTQVTPNNPQLMVIAGSNLYGSFTGAGIWKWDGTTWTQTTPNNPQLMVTSGSNLYGSFTGGGIWKWDGTNWTQVTPNNPGLMAATSTILYGSFAGGGIWQLNGTTWTQVTPNNPDLMVATSTILYGSFAGGGIWQWNGNSWTQLTPNNPASMVLGY